ncbi:MAG TPA: S8 family serine peptidase [Micromonosporaceae bacterium]
MSPTDKDRLADAKARGEKTVTLLVAAQAGQSVAVADGLAGLGATVQYRDDALGYLRAQIATDKAEQAAGLAGVQAAELDALTPLPDPRPEGQVNPTPQPAPGAQTPVENDYMPTRDIGAPQFVKAHPSLDGRGVTVGVVDLGIDLDHPALQKTTTGERKIVDWVTATNPLAPNDGSYDPTWVNMKTNVSGPSFTVDGKTYTAPSAGSFRFGLFNERDARLGGEIGNDVNRDGNPKDSSGLFGVLWDGAATVWVDTNQDGSFADQAAMTNYKVKYDVGHFGTDNPNTAVAETMPFVVQVDGKNKFVNIGIVSGAHGTHVAGIIAANKMFGGQMSGAAPGAKLVSARACLFVTGCTNYAMIEGMIYLAKQANVDVINMSIGGLPGLNDGNNTRALLYDRLIEQTKVQLFFSAGNSGPGMNTVGDPSVASNVMSVGTYISDATWAANYGSTAPDEGTDNQHGFSSRGPREDGGFKPNIIAPGSAISSTPTWQAGGPVGGTYGLPPGYSMFNGTSMASPQATGGAALLISAAKAEQFQYAPDQLRQALNSTARFIKPSQAYEQGNGLINVGAAYDQLRTNIKTVEITGQVEVHTNLSGYLATPGYGTGIYDREGVELGKSYTRTYTLTRKSGGSKAITYKVSWVGNDGTFSSAGDIALPLNQAVSLPVQVNPAAVGEHSAILRLDDPSTVGVDFATMNVVVVANEFTAAANYQVKLTGEVGRNQVAHHFFRVPAGVPALKVDFSGPDGTPGTGQARFLRYDPWGLPVDSNASTSCYNPAPPGGSCAGGTPTSRTAAAPMAGVWEVAVEARRTSDADVTPYTLTVALLGTEVTPNPDVITSAQVGSPVARSYTFTNKFGEFTGRAAGGGALSSAMRATPTIADGTQQVYNVNVTSGSTSLRATIGKPSDAKADLDLFVYNCTTGTCVLAGQSADGDSEESVTIANPAKGAWRVLVDGYAVPAGTTSYNYIDVFTNSAFGSVAVTDVNAVRAVGASWTVAGTVTAQAAPEAGRILLGAVRAVTDSGVPVGSGEVVVESVTP